MINLMCINAKPILSKNNAGTSPEFMYGFGLIEGKTYQSSGMEIDNESGLLCYRIPEIHEDLNPLKLIERFREVEGDPHKDQDIHAVKKQHY